LIPEKFFLFFIFSQQKTTMEEQKNKTDSWTVPKIDINMKVHAGMYDPNYMNIGDNLPVCTLLCG
jgi:hypothetical protein